MDSGILLVDKPYGWSSHDVVNVVRRATGERRVGHAGTLDPLATGLLVVLVGREATRVQDAMMAGVKEYDAHVTFGARSATDDAEGPLEIACDWDALGNLRADAIKQIIPQFIGTIEQKAPAYSAVHVGGERLYAAARKGTLDESIIPVRTITIDEIELRSFHALSSQSSATTVQERLNQLNAISAAMVPREERAQKDQDRLETVTKLEQQLPSTELRVVCQKGTYIRALARDLGVTTGTGAFLSALRRTRVGEFSIEDAVAIDEIRAGKFALQPLQQ
jgi:tRNA pseudouridine55 synthase